ncbi:MFS transporter [Streptomyces sp. NPDC051133]|uniref:MFS transporter n=1 Tax=Streptomyces sp. NPDC051133 TaxID=3155521 RepID=UPI0034436F28
MVMLDQSVVAVALDPMAQDIGMTTVVMHWVVLVYVLSLASFVPIGAMTARRYGLVPTFRTGVVVFSLSSALCGVTPAGSGAEAFVLAARAMQGAGAALMLPVATTVISDVYDSHHRGRALTTYAGVAQVFFVMGPVTGALLTQFLGWRSVFLVNLPGGVLTLWVVGRARVPRRVSRKPLPVLQSLLVLPALSLVVLGVYESSVWGLAGIGVLSVGAALLIVSVRAVLVAPLPLLQLRLFRIRPYTVAVVITFLVQAAQFPVLVHGTVYLRQQLQMSVLGSGLALLPFVVSLALGTFMSGFVLDHWQSIRVPVVGGLFAATAGTVAWTSLLPFGTYPWMVTAMVLSGLGMGAPIPALSAHMMNTVPEASRGDASVLRQMLRQLGGVFGLALAGALLLAVNDRAADQAGTVRTPATFAVFVAADAVLGCAATLAATALPKKTAAARPRFSSLSRRAR